MLVWSDWVNISPNGILNNESLAFLILASARRTNTAPIIMITISADIFFTILEFVFTNRSRILKLQKRVS